MKTYTWYEAFEAVKKLNDEKYRGHSDWRLPNIHELFSLVNPEKVNPACDLEGTVAAYYWSSTTNANNTNNAWNVNFGYGNVFSYYKTGSHYVRAVRGEQPNLKWSETL